MISYQFVWSGWLFVSKLLHVLLHILQLPMPCSPHIFVRNCHFTWIFRQVNLAPVIIPVTPTMIKVSQWLALIDLHLSIRYDLQRSWPYTNSWEMEKYQSDMVTYCLSQVSDKLGPWLMTFWLFSAVTVMINTYFNVQSWIYYPIQFSIFPLSVSIHSHFTWQACSL